MSERQALVVGGGVAGLVAARALADHFERVTIVDRDRFPGGPEPRAGVPQSRHIHVLLARGAQLLERAFPGLSAELLDAGAVPITWPAEALVLSRSGWARRFPEGLTTLSLSRPLLEWALRRRVAGLGAVRFAEGQEVVGLLASPDRTRVRGARLRSRGAGAQIGELAADLVVDASGRESPAPRWLEDLGYAPPPETEIDALLGYATRLYAPPPDRSVDWKAAYVTGLPPDVRRGGVIVPIEGGRWLVTLVGYGRDYPPTDDAGFLRFARDLRSPLVYEAIAPAEPLGPISGFRQTKNRRRHYEALAALPEGLALLGDAVCAVNPVYGQGMTVAAIAATVLDRCLWEQRRVGGPGAGLSGFGPRFQAALARANAPAWLTATGEDLRYPTTEGAKPGLTTRLMHRYLDRVIRVSTEDPATSTALLRVLHMLAPPTALFHPRVAIAVLGGPRQPRLAEPPAAPSGGALASLPPPAVAADPPGLTHRYARLGDVRLHYVEAGSGPLVVLLHGFPEFWYSWRHQIGPLVAAGFRVVAPDMRGFNLSDKPLGVGSYDVSVLTRDVAGLIRACGEERATIVGHDWGGAVAWTFAIGYPAMVERLVVLNAPHPVRFFAGLRTARQLRRSAYMFAFQLPGVAELWAQTRFVRRALERDPRRPGAFSAAELERYEEAAARPGALEAGLSYYRALFRRNPARSLRESRRRIDAPTLVIWGDQDRYLGAELADPGRRLVPHGRVVHLPDASHWVQVDRPERVTELLLGFLGEARV